MSVGTGASSQSGETSPVASSWASSAAEPARAAASAASTSAVTWAWVVALPLTEPVATPSPVRTKLITVTARLCITPLVVKVLLAQRRLALVVSRTIVTQSSATEVASACSTSDWGVQVLVVIAGLPRRSC